MNQKRIVNPKLKFKREIIWYRYLGKHLKTTTKDGEIARCRVSMPQAGLYVFKDINPLKDDQTTIAAEVINLNTGEIYLGHGAFPQWTLGPLTRRIGLARWKEQQKKGRKHGRSKAIRQAV